MSHGPSPRRFAAITAIIVVDDAAPALDLLQALHETLAAAAADQEIVVIANEVPAETAQRLRELVEAIPDVTVHFLAGHVDHDTAVLVGLDQALGDWIVTLTPTAGEITALPAVLDQAGTYEVVFGASAGATAKTGLYPRLAGLYFRAYSWLAGTKLDWPPPRIRLYSRSAARHLASQADSAFALRALAFSGAFPGTRIVLPDLDGPALPRSRPREALRKALRALLGTSALPLRLVIAVSVLTGALAVASSLYALIVYFLKADVAPGWTTLSLQISMMMLLFSMIFALLSEYVLNLYRAMAPRRRILIVRELRSPSRSDIGRLNVLGSDGSYQLGAPADVAPIRPRPAEPH